MKNLTQKKKILDINSNPQLFLDMAEDCSQRGQHEKAVSLIKRTLQSKPNDINATFMLADELALAGLPNLSNDILFKILAKDPEDIDAILSLGENFYAMGKWDVAAFYFKKYSTMSHDTPLPEIDVNDINFGSSRDFKIVYPMSKEAAEELRAKATALIREGKIEQGIAIYNEIEANFSKDAVVKNDIAFASLLKNDFENAEKYALQSLAINKGDINAQCNLLMAYNLAGKDSERDKLADILYETKATRPQDIFKIASTFCEVKKHKYAFVWLNKFIKNTDNIYHDVLLLLAFAAFNCEQFDDCLKALNQILLLDPENTIVLYYKNLATEYMFSTKKSRHIKLEYYPQLPLPEIGKRITELRACPDFFGIWTNQDMLSKIKWAFDTIEDYKLHINLIEKIAMTDKTYSTPYLKNLLLNQNLGLNAKGIALFYLMTNGLRGKFFMVRDGYFTVVNVPKNIPHILCNSILLCIAKLATIFLVEDAFASKIVASGKKIQSLMLEGQVETDVEDDLFAAVIARECGFETLDDQIICNLFNVTYKRMVTLSDFLFDRD